MRIRTVKPEFWTHPVTGRWPGELQAFALSLLNAADDFGYFFADPTLVRSAVRPFDEDSTRTRRMLDEASRAGWIEVREHPQMGRIARIVNFTKHQRIDRKTPSKIADYFSDSGELQARRGLDEDSTNARRGLDEDSLPEQGTGNREQGKEQGTTMSSLPLDLSAPGTVRPEQLEDRLTDAEFQVFEHWRVTLKHQRAKATPERKRLIAKALKAYTVEELQQAITGVTRSPHHMGQNDRHTRYDDLELILRDAKHIEGFIRLGAT